MSAKRSSPSAQLIDLPASYLCATEPTTDHHQAWRDALDAEPWIDSGRLDRGREYARSGQVLHLEIKPHRLTADVAGSHGRQYTVTLELTPLQAFTTKAEQDAILDSAIFPAPYDLRSWRVVFAAAGIALYPRPLEGLDSHCSCPDDDLLCKHAIAVHDVFGHAMGKVPELLTYLWQLPGADRTRILAKLKASDDDHPEGASAAARRPGPHSSAKATVKPLPAASGPLPDSFEALQGPLPSLDDLIDGAPPARDFAPEVDRFRYHKTLRRHLFEHLNRRIATAAELSAAWLLDLVHKPDANDDPDATA